MKRTMLVPALAAAAAIGAAGCGAEAEREAPGQDSTPAVHFGWLLGAPDVAAIALEADPPTADGTRTIRAYVCDGLGPPRGKAVWFKGTLTPGRTLRVRSAGGRERLVIRRFDDGLVQGSFKGRKRKHRYQFVAYPATLGAGIYEVSVDEDLAYSGVSTTGHELSATANRRTGRVTGTVQTADGERVDFTLRVLALASPAHLRSHGLRTRYRKYRRKSLVPGEYVAVVSPGSTHWLGRSGNVRSGSPGPAIIGLDKKE